jgi:ribosomal protein S12 methylthiotransferase
MRRPAAQEKTLDRIRAWRDICPSLTIRSSFIVGFPGETDEDFAALLDWLSAAELDRVGCFRYEAVDGAVANDLAAAVAAEVKEQRWRTSRRFRKSGSSAKSAAASASSSTRSTPRLA